MIPDSAHDKVELKLSLFTYIKYRQFNYSNCCDTSRKVKYFFLTRVMLEKFKVVISIKIVDMLFLVTMNFIHASRSTLSIIRELKERQVFISILRFV